MRSLTQAYFSPDRPLHLSFTHLVCRSAIEGNLQGPPSQGPAHPQHPCCVGFHLHCRRTDSPAQGGLGCDPGSIGWVWVGAHQALGFSGEQAQRMDLSHPVHADNCVLDPDTGECWREPPAYTYRDYRSVALQGLGGAPGWGLTACLLFSSLPSGLLYLNDDFQGGDLFFTEPNALTVTVTGGPGGREGSREPSHRLGIQSRGCPEANAARWLGPPLLLLFNCQVVSDSL